MTPHEEIHHLRQSVAELLQGESQAWEILGAALARVVGAQPLRDALAAQLAATTLLRGSSFVADKLVNSAIAACDAERLHEGMTAQ